MYPESSPSLARSPSTIPPPAAAFSALATFSLAAFAAFSWSAFAVFSDFAAFAAFSWSTFVAFSACAAFSAFSAVRSVTVPTSPPPASVSDGALPRRALVRRFSPSRRKVTRTFSPD